MIVDVSILSRSVCAGCGEPAAKMGSAGRLGHLSGRSKWPPHVISLTWDDHWVFVRVLAAAASFEFMRVNWSPPNPSQPG